MWISIAEAFPLSFFFFVFAVILRNLWFFLHTFSTLIHGCRVFCCYFYLVVVLFCFTFLVLFCFSGFVLFWFCFLYILKKISLLQVLEKCRVYLNKFTSYLKESQNNVGYKRSGNPISSTNQVLWPVIASCPITTLLIRVPFWFFYTLPLGRWKQNRRSSFGFIFSKRKQQLPLFLASLHVTYFFSSPIFIHSTSVTLHP